MVLLVLSSSFALAHEDASEADEAQLKARVMSVVIISSILVTAAVILSIIFRKISNHKTMLFLLIIIPVLVTTLYTVGSTIYLNQISVTKGPVHWHADFEIWNCGEKIDLIDSQGLSNRVGTPVFHEHDDSRVHIEGVVVNNEEISLGNFFNIVGGSLTKHILRVRTNQEILSLHNGDLCNGEPGKIQVFLYKVVNPEEQGNWSYVQEKVEDYVPYALSPYLLVPPGDCIIVEFDLEKEKTDKICTSYEAAITKGELHGG